MAITRTKLRVTIDLIVIILLIFFSSSSFSNISIVRVGDEIILILLTPWILLKFIKKHTLKAKLIVTIFLLIAYPIVLLFLNDLPMSNLVQVFIYYKFLIIFLYFGLKDDNYKIVFYQYFWKLIVLIFYVSLFVTIAQFGLPSFFDKSLDGRGINGITAGGVFFSRTIYASFIVFFIVLLLTIKDSESFLKVKYKKKLIYICFLLLFLTFTRKDIVIALFLWYFISMEISRRGFVKTIWTFILITIISISPVIIDNFFGKINKKTFTDEQVRLSIFDESLKVSKSYFPLGSGPGTFGSIKSVDYQEVYRKHNVPERIYLGYGDKVRGPIFDVFIMGLFVEYGIGVFLYFVLFFIIYKYPVNEKFSSSINVVVFKKYILLYVCLVSVLVPIFNNVIGYLIFIALGLLLYNNPRKRKPSESLS